MKTTRDAVQAQKNNIAMLASMLDMTQQNLKGSQGSERLRLTEQETGIRAQMKALGA